MGLWDTLTVKVLHPQTLAKVGEVNAVISIQGNIVHSKTATTGNELVYIANTADDALMLQKHIIEGTVYFNGLERVIVSFILDEIRPVVDQEDGTIFNVVSGPDVSKELSYRRIPYQPINDGNDPADVALNDVGILIGLMVDPVYGYDTKGTGNALGTTDGSNFFLAGQSVLNGLEMLRQISGEFWRLRTPYRNIRWVADPSADPSGITLQEASPGTDTTKGFILNINGPVEEYKSLCTHVIARGAGNWPTRFSFANVSGSMETSLTAELPSGYSADFDDGTITHDALATTLGVDIELPFDAPIEPIAVTEGETSSQNDIDLAGQALFRGALHFLKQRASAVRKLEIEAILLGEAWPLQTITVNAPSVGISSETWVVNRMTHRVVARDGEPPERITTFELVEELGRDEHVSGEWQARQAKIRQDMQNRSTTANGSLAPVITDELVKVSATDTTAGRLDSKLTVDSTLTKTITSPGGNEGLQLSQTAAQMPAHVLADTSGLGTKHTTSGLTAGMVLQATGAAAARFKQADHDDLGGVTANQHHNQSHVLAGTAGLGADHTVSGLTSGQVLRATGATTAAFQSLVEGDLPTHDITGSKHSITASQYQVVGATAVNALGLLTPTVSGTANSLLRLDANQGTRIEYLGLGATIPSDPTRIACNGDLQFLGSESITTTANGDLTIAPDGTGDVILSGCDLEFDASAEIRLTAGDLTIDPAGGDLFIDADVELQGGTRSITTASGDLSLRPSDKVLVNSITDDSRFVNVELGVIDGVLGSSYSGGSSLANLISYGTGEISGIKARAARGTRASPTATQSGDEIARFGGSGYGTSFPTNSKGYMSVFAGQNWTAANQGTTIRFHTTPNNSTISAEVARFSGAGNLGIGSTSPSSLLELGFATETLEFVDAGSSGATEQDWVEVEVNGVVGYIRVYASK